MPARDGFSTSVALSSTWRPRRAAGSDVVRARSQLAAVASASASLKTRESAWRFEGRRADPLARPAGPPAAVNAGRDSLQPPGRGARTRAIRHATAATAAPSGSAARQRLARRLERVFSSARMLSTKAGDNVISGRALETQTRRARRKVSYLARTSRHRAQPRAWVQPACPPAPMAADNASVNSSYFDRHPLVSRFASDPE
jgi:hypothetical protein